MITRDREGDLEIALKAVTEFGVNFNGIIVIIDVGMGGFGARNMHFGSGTGLVCDFNLGVCELVGVVLVVSSPWRFAQQLFLRLSH